MRSLKRYRLVLMCDCCRDGPGSVKECRGVACRRLVEIVVEAGSTLHGRCTVVRGCEQCEAADVLMICE